MTNSTEAIAEALREHQHDFDPHGHINGTVPGQGTHDCWCGEVFATADEQADHAAAAVLAALVLREEADPDQGLAARQVLRAYIDDERLVRKAYGELLSVLELREEDETP